MLNKVYYIKPENNDLAQAVKIGFLKALSLVSDKKITNIKFVVTGLDQLNPPNAISEGLDLLFKDNGINFTNSLRSNRGFPLVGWPTDEETTGVNLLLLNNTPTFTDQNTVVLLIWGAFESFKKLESILFHTKIELIAVLYNETDNMNELLSSTKAINISKNNDTNVTPYVNNFPNDIAEVLNKLKGINITNIASHTPTRERMKIVIDELKEKRLTVSYVDFLGFLVNDVNFPLKESVALLNWKHTYFGR